MDLSVSERALKIGLQSLRSLYKIISRIFLKHALNLLQTALLQREVGGVPQPGLLRGNLLGSHRLAPSHNVVRTSDICKTFIGPELRIMIACRFAPYGISIRKAANHSGVGGPGGNFSVAAAACKIAPHSYVDRGLGTDLPALFCAHLRIEWGKTGQPCLRG